MAVERRSDTARLNASESDHPYIGRIPVSTPGMEAKVLEALNADRHQGGSAVEVTYYFSLNHDGAPFEGIARAGRMVLEHGTLKPWHAEGDAAVRKPDGYDSFMSWATSATLLESGSGGEAGLITIAYPLAFFDKRSDGRFPLSQFLMAAASEPCSAFSFYRAAKIVDVKLPAALQSRCIGTRWPHARIRSYLELDDDEPLIGTIVKPKTGLTPELFSRSVVEAATAGARFTKADENMHLTLKEVSRYVGRVVQDLKAAGFDLALKGKARGKRFLFAPHITTDVDSIDAYARAALEAGANALMFSPYYSGGFLSLSALVEKYDVPVYAHTAGMNVTCGSPFWGIDSRVMYMLAGLFGAAFMQLPTMNGYLRPLDVEKPAILATLRENGLEGMHGMTLAIAGGMGPKVIGANMMALGETGRMFLAGTSVYSHPDGPTSGVKALLAAYKAYKAERITDVQGLRAYAEKLGGDEGKALLRSL
ncbi:MAG: RuBisCO large subunit C-terminal-like domain-containing protein [Spirochaetia bacterium]